MAGTGARVTLPVTSYERDLEKGGSMFDVRLSDEQREFQKLARDFAQKELKPKAMPLDRHNEFV